MKWNGNHVFKTLLLTLNILKAFPLNYRTKAYQSLWPAEAPSLGTCGSACATPQHLRCQTHQCPPVELLAWLTFSGFFRWKIPRFLFVDPNMPIYSRKKWLLAAMISIKLTLDLKMVINTQWPSHGDEGLSKTLVEGFWRLALATVSYCRGSGDAGGVGDIFLLAMVLLVISSSSSPPSPSPSSSPPSPSPSSSFIIIFYTIAIITNIKQSDHSTPEIRESSTPPWDQKAHSRHLRDQHQLHIKAWRITHPSQDLVVNIGQWRGEHQWYP